MRRRVRAAVRASTALHREHKSARKARRRRTITRPWVYRLLFLVIGMVMLMQRGVPVTLIIAFTWLWTLASAFLRATQLCGSLYFSPGLNVFHHLPISDRQIFQIQWKYWIRNSLWSALDFFVAYAALASHIGKGLDFVVAGAFLGTLQWVVLLGMAVVLFAWLPQRFLRLSMVLLTGCAVGLLVFGWRQPALVNWLSEFAYWVPPMGWILHAVGIIGDAGVVHDALPAVIAGAMLVAFPVAYSRIRRAYVLDEEQFAAARKATVTGEAAASPWQEFVDRFTDEPAAVESDLRSRRFLERLDWRRLGWTERLVAQILTARERVVTEFLVAANPQWTRKFRGFLTSAVVLVLLARLVIPLSGFDPEFLMFLVVYFVAAQSAGNWRGFATISATGLQPPLYSFYPIGFWELFRAVLKANTARYALSIPVIAVAIVLAMDPLKLSSASVVLYGWRVMVLGFLAQPILAIAPISAASNDSNKLGFAAAAVAFVFATLGIGFVFVFVSSPALIITSLLILCAFLALGVMIYARRFNRSRFDLIPVTKTASGSPQ